MILHHTMGVYANGERKHNFVEDCDLKNHILYNRMNRPGRALFVDGKCVVTGYLGDTEIEEIEKELAAKPMPLPSKPSIPYQ